MRRPSESTAAIDELARRFGYESYMALFENSLPVGTAWFLTSVDGWWILWSSERPLEWRRFATYDEALASLSQYPRATDCG